VVPEPGQTIERYVIEAELGRGGMAVVYRVRHARLGSLHALKVLTISSAGLQRRLLQEGQAQATLRHPHVVSVTDVIDVHGQPGLVMEYVEGPTLEAWLDDHRPDLAESERIFRAILSAVEAAHAAGLVHRDLKPANVLLAPASGGLIPKVADFGLAKAVEEDHSGHQATRSGVAMGTPRYMAPEQVRDARRVDRRADVFSLGCILYELVTGEAAFEGPDVLSVFNRVCAGDFRAPEALVPDLPPAVLTAIRGCLVVDAERRIPDCATLRAVLEGAPYDIPPPSNDPRPTLAPAGSFRSDETWAGASTVDLGDRAPKHQGKAKSPSLSPPIRRWGLAAGVAVLGGVGLAVAGLGVGLFFGVRAWAVAQVHTSVAEISGGDAKVGGVWLGLTGIELSDLVVQGRDGRNVANIKSIRLDGPGLFLGLGPVRRAVATGVLLELRQDSQGWMTPAATNAVALRERADQARFGPVDVVVGDLSLAARAPDGTLDATVENIEILGLRRDSAGFAADSWAVSNLAVRDERPVLSVGSLRGNGQETRVEGLDLWIRTRRDGFLDWPPVVVDAVPTWMGGKADQVAWPADLPLSSVLSSASIVVGRGTVQVVDNAHASRDVTWVVDLEEGRVFAEGDDARLTARGRNGDAELSLDVRRTSSGEVAAHLDVAGLALERLEPYLSQSLAQNRVVVSGGTVRASIDIDEHGEAVGWAAAVEVASPTFVSATGVAGDVPARSRRLLQARDRVTAAGEGLGVLRDPSFTPVRDLVAVVSGALFDPPTSRLARLLQPRPSPAPRSNAPPPEPTPNPTPEDGGDVESVPPTMPKDLEERWRKRQEAARRWIEEATRQVPKK
jgi:hypothetical protein